MTTPAPITPAQYRIMMGFAGLLIAGGTALVLFGGFFLKTAWGSHTWPSTPGEVEDIQTIRYTTGSNGSTRTYRYTITYEYRVEGQSYRSDRFSLGSGSTASRSYDTSRAARRAGQEAYPPGSEITVYYDPADPTSTVLKPGANFGTYVPLTMGLLFLPSGLLFLKVFHRIRPSQG
jgi:hypothetical protein